MPECIILAIIFGLLAWIFGSNELKIIALLCLCVGVIITAVKVSNKPKLQPGRYYLDISDSPHVPNVHPELDYTSNDTAHINWYSNMPVIGYQLYLMDDSVQIWDNGRRVGALSYDTPLGKILTKDNE